MPPAARIGDQHACPSHGGGPVVPKCEPTVLIGNRPAARKGDNTVCKGSDAIQTGESSVLIGDQMAARVTDMTSHGGALTSGEPTVWIGHTTSKPCYLEAAERGSPFIRFAANMPTPFVRGIPPSGSSPQSGDQQ